MDIKCDHCGVFNDMADSIVISGSRVVCRAQRDCKTRQKLIATIRRRNMSQQSEAVEASYNPDYYHMKAKELVALDFNEEFAEHEGRADVNMFYVVWFAKVLGNWKALVSTDIINGQYWEVTYNGNKDETYVDRYVKASNRSISDEAYAAMS